MALWKALKQLYPNADPFWEYRIRREADGSEQIIVWNLPQPQPTEAEINAASAAYNATQTAAQTEATTLRQQIVTTAQSAVGVSITALTAAQVRALVALLLWKEGAIKADGTIRPLAEWVK